LSGILHGKSASYLSEVMPNSFSMAPRYVRQFVAETGFQPAERDVFACLEAKIRRLFRDGPPRTRGVALHGDARDAGARAAAELRARALPERARLVLTSPPYLRVVKYGYYNWLRMWFLGIDPDEVDALLDDAHLLVAYLPFMREVLAGLREWLAADAVVVLVIGDVELDRGRRISNGLGLAESVWREAAEPEGYLLAGVALDDIVAQRKMTKIWGAQAGRATKTDRLLVIAPHELGRRRALSGAVTPIDWSSPRGTGVSVRIGRAVSSSRAGRIGRPVRAPTADRIGRLVRSGPPADRSGRLVRSGTPSILAADAADVSPGRSRGDGSAGADEEPRPRAHDEPPAELHPAAAGPPVRP
jgi:site-specific DNA-methyltransferase (adenine-specific)